ncbi:hypothetical protein MNBD_DELTA01-1742 [hydrothermal vent metagenome]|uniref:Chemotaxis protein CheZ n=1 Tax=hydrothermal vent metagenome TaxID=652676 RepID=A0A3B0RL33_9ZZZZ
MSEEKWDSVLHDLKGELSELANFVEKTKTGIEGVESTVKAGNEALPQATDQLHAVTVDLEKAANTIMSILEHVMNEQDRAVSMLGVLKSWAQDLEEKKGTEGLGIISVLETSFGTMRSDMTEILTHMSFQDLSGQKIKKVMTGFSEVQNKILELAVTFGLQASHEEVTEKGDLLDELKDVSVSMDLKQDIVDKIFNEMNKKAAT